MPASGPTVPRPVDLGRDTPRRRATRAALAAVIWDAHGRRRLPTERALSAALDACDPRDVWWVCEASSAGPVYLLPTREWVRALGKLLDELGVRTVHEIAAGDGFLSAALAAARPGLRVTASDSGAWARPHARMSARERRDTTPFAGITALPHVERRAATPAVTRARPDLVLVSWAPPGLLVERAIGGPTRYVLDLGVDGDVCGNGPRTWRFNKEFLEGPIESRARCRLDGAGARHTRATLYFGRRHPEFGTT